MPALWQVAHHVMAGACQHTCHRPRHQAYLLLRVWLSVLRLLRRCMTLLLCLLRRREQVVLAQEAFQLCVCDLLRGGRLEHLLQLLQADRRQRSGRRVVRRCCTAGRCRRGCSSRSRWGRRVRLLLYVWLLLLLLGLGL